MSRTEAILVNGATSLPFPPVVSGADVSLFRAYPGGRMPELDLEIWSALSVDLTLAELFGGALHAGTIADDTFTAANATEICTATAHGLMTGDGPVQLTTTTTLPAGFALATDYWIIKLSADTFKLAASLADALAGTAVAITDDGTGTHTLSDTADTKRMVLHSCGLLGNAADGAISLTAVRGYNVRIEHRARTVMYWISATLSAANAVNAAVYPVTP